MTAEQGPRLCVICGRPIRSAGRQVSCSHPCLLRYLGLPPDFQPPAAWSEREQIGEGAVVIERELLALGMPNVKRS